MAGTRHLGRKIEVVDDLPLKPLEYNKCPDGAGLRGLSVRLKIGYGAWHDSGFAKMGETDLMLSGVAIATGSVLLGFITFGISTVGFILGLKDVFATDTGSKVAGALASVSGLIGLGCSYQTIDFDRLLE